MTSTTAGELELADRRREVAEFYATCGHVAEPHALSRDGRDRLFQEHPQSPWHARTHSVPGWPTRRMTPTLRWELAVQPLESDHRDHDLRRRALPHRNDRRRRPR
jgi:uncharacterized protein